MFCTSFTMSMTPFTFTWSLSTVPPLLRLALIVAAVHR